MIWPIVSDLIVAIGAGVMFFFTGVWSFVWGILLDVRDWISARRTVALASDAKSGTSPDFDGLKRLVAKQIQRVDDHAKRFDSLEAFKNRIEPPAPPPETNEEKIARLEKLVQSLSQQSEQTADEPVTTAAKRKTSRGES